MVPARLPTLPKRECGDASQRFSMFWRKRCRKTQANTWCSGQPEFGSFDGTLETLCEHISIMVDEKDQRLELPRRPTQDQHYTMMSDANRITVYVAIVSLPISSYSPSLMSDSQTYQDSPFSHRVRSSCGLFVHVRTLDIPSARSPTLSKRRRSLSSQFGLTFSTSLTGSARRCTPKPCRYS